MAINYELHQHEDVARIFRALSEPSRLTLIHCLADGPHRVGELSAHLGLSQSTVSAHLALLKVAGLVAATPDGRATLYRLAHPGLDDLLHAGERLVTPGEQDPAHQGHHNDTPLTPIGDTGSMGRRSTGEAALKGPVVSA
ncbi:helix-turn-helix transcriptional regulator [Arthrobacter echini]|uniref:Helix-turn-helix transcriptional regulator n=2 Tax=Arthrobacter echini TaxID=1529066 RepID=A0A4S5E2N2_9MICC|nr:metalloregulator ArsR/SmtB family transcription factor [Arthrobacter echini]THJ65603.1 helix-turn-helix transcriptional regulator [Arthrobacter echini]TYC96061.1 helix-turn-helix transcriptional regulator [Arthrobacter echini]